jgi:hypothetical protein
MLQQHQLISVVSETSESSYSSSTDRSSIMMKDDHSANDDAVTNDNVASDAVTPIPANCNDSSTAASQQQQQQQNGSSQQHQNITTTDMYSNESAMDNTSNNEMVLTFPQRVRSSSVTGEKACCACEFYTEYRLLFFQTIPIQTVSISICPESTVLPFEKQLNYHYRENCIASKNCANSLFSQQFTAPLSHSFP